MRKRKDTCQRLVRPRGIGYADPALPHSCLVRLVDYPHIPLETRARETIKAGRTALVVRTELPLDNLPRAVAYKRVRRRNRFKVFTALLRSNRTLRNWRLGRLLLKRGVPTARPLAAIIPRARNAGAPSYLVTEWIDGALNLAQYLEWVTKQPEPRQSDKLKALAESLGALLGCMHACRISHRDLKPGNLLVIDRGERLRTCIIDLDGACSRRRISQERQRRDLARLVIGVEELDPLRHTLRARFLKAWIYASDEPLRDWKRVWRQLAESSRRLRRRRAAHKRRRCR